MIVRGDTSGIDEMMRKVEGEYLDRIADAGERACAEAVAKGNYQNRTGNLRSSIGFVIAYDGKIIRMGGFHKVQGRGENMQKVEFTTKDGKNVSFWAKGKFGDGTEGVQVGLDFAREKIKGTKGYAFILVAGMEYASYVSSKGFDVTDSAQILVWKLIKD